MSITNNPLASGSAFTLDMGKDSSTGNQVQKVALTEPAGGTFITPMQQTGGSVTALSSGAVVNPTSVLTRPSTAVTSSVTATASGPCTFTWTGNPLVNGQTVVLGGTTVPAGFTAGITYFVVNVSGNTFQLALTVGGSAIASTSTGTAVTATLVYATNELIASATAPGSIAVPNWALPSTGILINRVRLLTNALSGWNAVTLSVNLWSAAPTYTNGDGQPYAPATGSASWLANFLVGLTQYGDGAAGAGQLTGSNQVAIKVGSLQNIWWDVAIQSSNIFPIASQTFTLTTELMQ
jgi:hypothetical protein